MPRTYQAGSNLHGICEAQGRWYVETADLADQDGRTVKLSDLRGGPVVVYFYPKAFTPGCTVEAHNFAEATDKFAALGATLVGMSGDNIDTLKEFSVKECRNKFAVAADADGKIMKKYDANLAFLPSTADRISYVISPEGKVVYTYSSMDPDDHVANTLKVIQDLHAKH